MVSLHRLWYAALYHASIHEQAPQAQGTTLNTMNTKHTPGPWRIGVRQPHSDKFIYGADGTEIANCDRLTNFPDENLANARLIAAAPDGLSVAMDIEQDVNTFLAGCEIEGYEPSMVPEHVALFIERMSVNVEGLRAAIAKATGQE